MHHNGLTYAQLGMLLSLSAIPVVTVPAYAAAIVTWTCGEILLVPLAAAFMADHAPTGHGSTFQGRTPFVWTLGLAVGAPAGQFLLAAAGPAPLWSGTLLLGRGVAAAHLLLADRCPWPGSRSARVVRTDTAAGHRAGSPTGYP